MQVLDLTTLGFHDVIKCLSMKQETILLNNLGSKGNPVMKFGQFM